MRINDFNSVALEINIHTFKPSKALFSALNDTGISLFFEENSFKKQRNIFS